MNHSSGLLIIKLFHTINWAFFVTLIFYVLYSGISGRINLSTWIAMGLTVGEGFVLAHKRLSASNAPQAFGLATPDFISFIH